MKGPICATISLFLTSFVCLGQTQKPEGEPNLQKLSQASLIACFANWQLCGVDNKWDIADELARRGDVSPLLRRYWREPDPDIRNGIECVAYRFDSPEVLQFMKAAVAKKVDDGEDRYYPIQYLAKRCDAGALSQLSTGRYRNKGSLQYQTSVELFGKCEYRPAIPYLVDTALYDSSLNIVIAAQQSLQELYPHSKKDFSDLEDVQRYYCRLARGDGLQVHCKENN